ncbi:MAG: hypothetical protein V4598_10040 [Bdellovibrionota bacterium]
MITSYCHETGISLDKLKGVILVEWETLLRKVIASSEHESTVILMDHIPEILSQLESILKKGHVDEIELGKHHGYFRSLMTNYSLSDVLTEYSLLREVLIHNLYPMGDMGCSKLIHKFIDILTKHSVIEYLNTQTVHQALSNSLIGNEIQELKDNPVIPTHQ